MEEQEQKEHQKEKQEGEGKFDGAKLSFTADS